MNWNKLEETAEEASLMLKKNRITAFLRLITPLMVIIAIGFLMFGVAAVCLIGLTLHYLYQGFVDGNVLVLVGGLILFAIEGLAVAIGSFEVLGGE